jgi:hypothetical protein
MRMWKVYPGVMCRNHLLGEHLEMHMFASAIKNGKRIDGYIRNGLVEIHNIVNRHNLLVREMNNRGWNHKTPMTNIDLLTNNNQYRYKNTIIKKGSINSFKSYNDLAKRCKECKRLINEN